MEFIALLIFLGYLASLTKDREEQPFSGYQPKQDKKRTLIKPPQKG